MTVATTFRDALYIGGSLNSVTKPVRTDIHHVACIRNREVYVKITIGGRLLGRNDRELIDVMLLLTTDGVRSGLTIADVQKFFHENPILH